MKDEQYTAKGETFVMEENFSKSGFYRPLVIHVKDKKGSRKWGGWRSNQSSYQPRRRTGFGNYKGYVPYWYRDLREHQWDRWKLIGITALVSPVLFEKLPALLKVFFQP